MPRTMHCHNDDDKWQLNQIEQKAITSGCSVGSLSDLMKSPRLDAGEDWELEKKLNLNN